MGERPGRHDPLLGEGDRGGLDRADPDRQVTLPGDSFSSTIGWLEGISTRTPTTSSLHTLLRFAGSDPCSTYTGAGVRVPVRSHRPSCPQPERTSVACSRTDRPASSRAASSARSRAPRVALAAHQRRDDLLDQPDLALGGGPERPQVAGAQAERGHLRDGLAMTRASPS